MSHTLALRILTATAVATACIAGAAHASGPRDSNFTGDKYGYNFRIDSRDVYSDGARGDRFDTFSDGARDIAPATASCTSTCPLAGMDRRGVSSDPARKVDVYTDGALA